MPFEDDSYIVTKVLAVDKEVSTMKGAKVDAFFKPKTQAQLKDQQVFFKETKARLQTHRASEREETSKLSQDQH